MPLFAVCHTTLQRSSGRKDPDTGDYILEESITVEYWAKRVTTTRPANSVLVIADNEIEAVHRYIAKEQI